MPHDHDPVADTDLRDLPAPEPMLRALEIADALAPGGQACVLTPMFPAPLFDALDARGLRHRAEPHPAHGVRVLILRPFLDGATGD